MHGKLLRAELVDIGKVSVPGKMHRELEARATEVETLQNAKALLDEKIIDLKFTADAAHDAMTAADAALVAEKESHEETKAGLLQMSVSCGTRSKRYPSSKRVLPRSSQSAMLSRITLICNQK